MAFVLPFTRASRNASIARELDLTTRGLAGGMASTINDFGFQSRIEVDSAGAATGRDLRTTWGREWTTRGRGNYVAPVAAAREVTSTTGGRTRTDVGWRSVRNVEEMYGTWDDYIRQGANNSFFGNLRLRAYEFLGGGSAIRDDAGRIVGGQMSGVNRFIARAGGVGTMLPAGIATYFAAKDAIKGYDENGVFGAITGAAKGYVTGAMGSRVIGMSLLNPLTAGVGAAALGGMAYSAYKTFSVRSEGNEYLKQKKMSVSGWQRGPSQAFGSSIAMTMRQRSIQAMENSKFNGMKSLGNESFMMSAPRSRYANSTAIGNAVPIIAY
jgi:hypothetical protein